jgi:hypothetical protein
LFKLGSKQKSIESTFNALLFIVLKKSAKIKEAFAYIQSPFVKPNEEEYCSASFFA